MLQIVAKLGVADLLASGPRPVAELADATATNADALKRVLRALTSVGVFASDGQERYGLTPLGECLRSDARQSIRNRLIMHGTTHWQNWGELEHSLRTGLPAFERAFGKPLFDYLASDPDASLRFDQSMAYRGAIDATAVVAAYDFSDATTVVDVGGGNGTLLAAVLAAAPSARGVLFDLPHVVAGSGSVLLRAGLSERVRVEGGSFFDAVPRGGDVYLLQKVLHDWDDERSIRILANCRTAMEPSARLLVLETLVPPGDAPHFSKLIDVHMLVETGGRERTGEEFDRLLAGAGLRLQRTLPTASETVSVLEACPV
jgi:hypothetical protein